MQGKGQVARHLVEEVLLFDVTGVRGRDGYGEDAINAVLESQAAAQPDATGALARERTIETFGGRVPDTMEGLLRLPGVARKTANVVLGTWFGKNDGVVVDTHVGRLAQRMGLTWRARNDKDAVRIEADLMELIPRDHWTYFAHAMIHHGRAVCSARNPQCETCSLSGLCPAAGSFA